MNKHARAHRRPRRSLIPPLALVGLAATLVASPAGAQIPLADKGVAKAVIVLPEEPTQPERSAAEELTRYLGLATGASFEKVVEGKLKADQPAILVGATALARAENLVPEGAEAWRIKTFPAAGGRAPRLVIAGGHPRGTPYGVWNFLEDVAGVHWWNQWEEDVPRHKMLIAPAMDKSGEPDFYYREFRGNIHAPQPMENFVRNRVHVSWPYEADMTRPLGGTRGFGLPFQVHTFEHYLPVKKHFAEHPEWYSEIKGERRNGRTQLCLTNPEVFDEVLKRLKGYIEETRKTFGGREFAPSTFSISPNDWTSPCQCEQCSAMVEKEGCQTGPVLWFVNKLAAAIEKDYPDVYLETLAYSYYRDVPRRERPRDNVVIRLCTQHLVRNEPVTDPANQPFQDWIESWSAVAPNIYIWHYAVTYSPYSVLPHLLPKDMATTWRYMRENNVTGAFIEYEYPVTGAWRDLNMWVYSKLFEDLDRDPDALTAQFCDGYYGPGGLHVKAAIDLLAASMAKHPGRVTWRAMPIQFPYLTLDFLTRADALMEKAEQAVADNDHYLPRVRHARTPIDASIIGRWSYLVKEHAAGPNAKQPMPLDRDAAYRRLRTACLWALDQRYPESEQSFKKRRQDILQKIAHLDKVRRLTVKAAPLPDELKEAEDRTVELTADVFGYRPGIARSDARLVEDKMSPTGVTGRFLIAQAKETPERYLVTDKSPFVFGIYDYARTKTLAKRQVKAADVPAPGYHLYRLENVSMTGNPTLYVSWSWNIQVSLGSLIAEKGEGLYDVCLSVRFTGPDMPHGSAEEENAIYVDRVFLVKQ